MYSLAVEPQNQQELVYTGFWQPRARLRWRIGKARHRRSPLLPRPSVIFLRDVSRHSKGFDYPQVGTKLAAQNLATVRAIVSGPWRRGVINLLGNLRNRRLKWRLGENRQSRDVVNAGQSVYVSDLTER